MSNEKRHRQQAVTNAKNKKNATALTVIKAIAAADGALKENAAYLTKLQMIHLCKRWLAERQKR
jgi:hypothetical protein